MTINRQYKRFGGSRLRVRPVVYCPGNDICPYGLVNTQALAEQLTKRLVGRKLPAKTKVAVSGCASGCTKPQHHDIGFRGAAEILIDQENCVRCQACVKHCPGMFMRIENGRLAIDYIKCLSCGVCMRVCPKKALKMGKVGYHIYIGGQGGPCPSDGVCIATFIAEEKVIPYLEAILAVYQELADKGQRLNTVLSKEGAATIKTKVENKVNGSLSNES